MPIVLAVIAFSARMVPRQPARREQPLNLTRALMLIVAILMLVFSAKSALKGQMALWLTGSIALVGLALLVALCSPAAFRRDADGRYAPVYASHYLKRRDDGDDRLITWIWLRATDGAGAAVRPRQNTV